MQNICILCSASAEIQLRVLAYSSETAKEFFSFYKLLGLRGLLKIFFWSSSSPPWVFQFILLLMVWNWVLLGLGTWSLLPSAQRNEGKKPLMQIRKKGRKKQPLIRLFHEQNSLKWTLMQWAFWENTASVNKPTAGNKKIPKAFIPSVLSSGILSSATAWRRGKKTCPGFGPGCSAVPAWQEGLTAYTRGLYSTEHLVLNKR